MSESLLSVGLDVGTTTTQLVVSQLKIENKASSFSVPEMHIAQRQILYKSDIYFTPLLQNDLVDGEKLRSIVAQEYRAAGILREQVDTGALIITGETSRKENARIIANSLSEFAGDFVVATAGPHLESILAAKGAGSDQYSQQTGKTVLHIDIGGGTSNLALIESGTIVATGCMNIGGRLLKLNEAGCIYYRSPALTDRQELGIGKTPTKTQLQALCNTMVQALEMACGLRPTTDLMDKFWTTEAGNPWLPPQNVDVISFSGGVAECINKPIPYLSYGDIGPLLGETITESLLCKGNYRLNSEAIRATVIGAGSYATQLSGSTVYHQNICFPIKNIPVVTQINALSQLDTPGIWILPPQAIATYEHIRQLADTIQANWPQQPVYIAAEYDIAKALGHALALRFGNQVSILCLDRVKLASSSYLDVGNPIGSALPVVIKTLILEQGNSEHQHGGFYETKDDPIGENI